MRAPLARALACVLIGAAPLAAQSSRLSLSFEAGEFRPRGGSEAFGLFDRALAPEGRAPRPLLAGGTLHVRLTPRWSLALAGERGGTSSPSVSRVRPASGVARQRTSLEFPSLLHAGAEWRAARWRGSRRGDDRARVVLGAGAGTARYRLRQWGDFVDETRLVAYADDLRSSGDGTFGYAAAAVEVPVRRWITVRAHARRQVGSAPMNGDFASFDRLDLGGTGIGGGLRITR